MNRTNVTFVGEADADDDIVVDAMILSYFILDQLVSVLTYYQIQAFVLLTII